VDLELWAAGVTGDFTASVQSTLKTNIATACANSVTSSDVTITLSTHSSSPAVVKIAAQVTLASTVNIASVAQKLWDNLNPNNNKDPWTGKAVHTVHTAGPVLGLSGSIALVKIAEGGQAYSVSAAGFQKAYSNGDPHMHLATGKRADFRGVDGKVYSALSAPNISLALQTTKSEFKQNFGKQTVHGTHFTKAFFALRSNTTGMRINVSITADITPWFSPITYVFTPGAKPIKVSATKLTTYAIEGINITAVSGSRVLVRAADWEVDLTRRGLYKPQPESKTRHYLDVVMRPTSASALYSHGIIGQSFNGEARANPQDGKLDDYTAAEVTTTAQAEGAIEGVYTDYTLSAPFQTAFKYSRFDKTPPVSSVATTFAHLAASTETNEAGSEAPMSN
jgi:hypothetical protein